MSTNEDPFGTKDTIKLKGKDIIIYCINKLEGVGLSNVSTFPFSIKVLLENILRNVDGRLVTKEDVEKLAKWSPKEPSGDIPFMPARVLLHDFTGVPAVVDLAALRASMQRLGGDPASINPLVPVDLIIDHSVQVDYFGTVDSPAKNEEKEFERNQERYKLLRWAQTAFKNFRVSPPGRGICHQVNLEYLGAVVQFKEQNGELVAYPDSLVGTDSHTPMVNSLGLFSFGVGGIEAEAVMLGQPYYMPIPEVVGVKLFGKLSENVTATDLVLTVTQMLREYGVVGKFVEFYGPGLKTLSVPDRATIANMSPEYGATVGFFPVDERTLEYLQETGRSDELIELIKEYTQKQGLFLSDDSPTPEFSSTLELDLSTVTSSLAGPTRPQDRINLADMKESFHEAMHKVFGKGSADELKDFASHCWLVEGGDHRADELAEADPKYKKWLESAKDYSQIIVENCYFRHFSSFDLTHGSLVIAAITSCTNTSNPSVLIGAGLLAKNAVEKGLKVNPYVKTSLAPGSRVVTQYLKEAGLLPYLEALGFHVVGYGCTTCIGNSGPLSEKVIQAIREKDLVVGAVLSGNRNFEGRISPHVKANYLASPPLVVAFALAGRVNIDMTTEPLGNDPNGSPVYLKDIWPSQEDIQRIINKTLSSEMFKEQYGAVYEGTKAWNDLDIPIGSLYDWDAESTYIQEPPFFQDFPIEPHEKSDITDARVIALVGDTITTDHISPAGAIASESPAGKYLISLGIDVKDFNSYGSRRGNHEVMMRGTFGNVRFKNKLVPGKEGWWTVYHPTGEELPFYDGAMRYRTENIPLLVIAGKEYGTGSSRDWAAKGTYLLGIKAVIAESFERIHRSNLVGMGVLPLQFEEGENAETLGLTGKESYDILGIDTLEPQGKLTVIVNDENLNEKQFRVNVRL
ncbi:MAG: aconitate hydratase, partial [Promethearchaeota archaeon]